jgi:hypothetical protein
LPDSFSYVLFSIPGFVKSVYFPDTLLQFIPLRSQAFTALFSATMAPTYTGVYPSGTGSGAASPNGSKIFGKLNTSMVESKFLSHPDELGVVAVGFSGGQVRSHHAPSTIAPPL